MNHLEKIENLSPLDRWVYALKIKSWPKLLVPFIFGQCFGMILVPVFNLTALICGLVINISLLIYIVLLNDYADIRVDTVKRRLFPADCSPKTIPDGILSKNSVLVAGLMAALFCIMSSIVAERIIGRPYIVFFSLICILVFVAYSLPPIQLNYRGGGELLEMAGVGIMLPSFHFYLQAGLVFDLHFILILILSTLYALSSALASGLSDELSDKEGGKITFVTLFGNRMVRRSINIILVISVIYLIGSLIYFTENISIVLNIIIIIYCGYYAYQVLQQSSKADTNQFDEQRIYKGYLHNGIWGTLSLLSCFQILIMILKKIN